MNKRFTFRHYKALFKENRSRWPWTRNVNGGLSFEKARMFVYWMIIHSSCLDKQFYPDLLMEIFYGKRIVIPWMCCGLINFSGCSQWLNSPWRQRLLEQDASNGRRGAVVIVSSAIGAAHCHIWAAERPDLQIWKAPQSVVRAPSKTYKEQP